MGGMNPMMNPMMFMMMQQMQQQMQKQGAAAGAAAGAGSSKAESRPDPGRPTFEPDDDDAIDPDVQELCESWPDGLGVVKRSGDGNPHGKRCLSVESGIWVGRFFGLSRLVVQTIEISSSWGFEGLLQIGAFYPCQVHGHSWPLEPGSGKILWRRHVT